MVGKIILGAIEVVPDITNAKDKIPSILDGPAVPKLFDFGAWLADGIKSALINLAEWIINGAIDLSYWGCMITAIISLLLYLAGIKKAGKWVTGSVVIYMILQMLKVAIESV